MNERCLSRPHDKVYERVVSVLKENNYEVLEFVYHGRLTEEEQEMLRNCFSKECLFLRCLPDLLAIKGNKTVFLEAKSKSRRYPNLAIELFPFAVYYILSEELNLDIIYVYGEEIDNYIRLKFLSVKDVAKFCRRVIITDKFDETINTYLLRFSTEKLGIQPEFKRKEEILKRKNQFESVGSSDPFILILKEDLDKLKDFNEFFNLYR